MADRMWAVYDEAGGRMLDVRHSRTYLLEMYKKGVIDKTQTVRQVVVLPVEEFEAMRKRLDELEQQEFADSEYDIGN